MYKYLVIAIARVDRHEVYANTIDEAENIASMYRSFGYDVEIKEIDKQ